MHPFSVLCKHQKALRLSDVFKRYSKSALAISELNHFRVIIIIIIIIIIVIIILILIIIIIIITIIIIVIIISLFIVGRIVKYWKNTIKIALK